MTKMRVEAWKKIATDEDFFEYLQDLAEIYAARKYDGNGNMPSDSQLFIDFKAWQDGIKKAEK